MKTFRSTFDDVKTGKSKAEPFERHGVCFKSPVFASRQVFGLYLFPNSNSAVLVMH